VVHPVGEVIKPDAWMCVADEGMPVHGRPYEKGNLYIRFAVHFPDRLDQGTGDKLRKDLPPDPAGPAANGRMETEDVEQARRSQAQHLRAWPASVFLQAASCMCACQLRVRLHAAVAGVRGRTYVRLHNCAWYQNEGRARAAASGLSVSPKCLLRVRAPANVCQTCSWWARGAPGIPPAVQAMGTAGRRASAPGGWVPAGTGRASDVCISRPARKHMSTPFLRLGARALAAWAGSRARRPRAGQLPYLNPIGMADGADARAQVSMRPIKDMEEELRARRQYAKAHSAEAYESSDEEDGMPRGQKVQCAQQ